MRHVRAFAVLCFIATAGLGCNPAGTCIHGDENSELGAICALEYPKRGCETLGDSQFFEEERTAGQLRCGEMGFARRPGGGDLLFLGGED